MLSFKGFIQTQTAPAYCSLSSLLLIIIINPILDLSLVMCGLRSWMVHVDTVVLLIWDFINECAIFSPGIFKNKQESASLNHIFHLTVQSYFTVMNSWMFIFWNKSVTCETQNMFVCFFVPDAFRSSRPQPHLKLCLILATFKNYLYKQF